MFLIQRALNILIMLYNEKDAYTAFDFLFQDIPSSPIIEEPNYKETKNERVENKRPAEIVEEKSDTKIMKLTTSNSTTKTVQPNPAVETIRSSTPTNASLQTERIIEDSKSEASDRKLVQMDSKKSEYGSQFVRSAQQNVMFNNQQIKTSIPSGVHNPATAIYQQIFRPPSIISDQHRVVTPVRLPSNSYSTPNRNVMTPTTQGSPQYNILTKTSMINPNPIPTKKSWWKFGV